MLGKWFRKSRVKTRASRLDQLYGELVGAVRVSEDEVAAASSSEYLYDRVRLRIAEIGERTKPRRSAYDRVRGFSDSLLSAPRFVVLSSAAAILVALVLGLLALLSGPSSTESAYKQAPLEATVSSNPPDVDSHSVGSAGDSSADLPNKPGHTSRKRLRSANRATEIATDFLPLTYVDDLSEQQSGHIVRMKVPRSALIAFGVPMNMERAGELITADVMIGDDGLARAIRFVQ